MNFRRAWSDASEIFAFRRARPIRTIDRVVLGVLIFLGLQSVVLFALWWFRAEHVGNGILFVLLSVAIWYGVARIVIGWYNLFHLEQPEERRATDGMSVAIFITSSPGEPYAMFERTLDAARSIHYPHTTYLLDDTRDPAFANLAREMGAVHLELVGLPGAKAGKINAALERTSEDFILILDPDHVPFPEILDRVLGYFDDPSVGFVQVAQAYYNVAESFVARAAAEQTYAFYGPMMQGMHGSGTAVAIGANCTFRRKALLSIGGHGVGLAEDLVTSIRLHAKKWRSVYVPEVVARGLVPSDLGSFTKQQLKWTRGVYEMLLHEYPRAFRTLTLHQRISYLMIGTYYLFGVTTLIYLVIPLLYLLTGARPAAMFLGEYARYGVPVAVFGILSYLYSQRWLCDPRRERGLHLRALLMKVGLWSVYSYGLVLALLRINVPYMPTAKEKMRSNFWRHAFVPGVTMTLTFTLVAWTAYERVYLLPESVVRSTTEITVGMIFFALVNVVYSSGRLYAAWKGR